MPASVNVLIVSEFIKKLRGGSQPILVRANDGLLYVLKFAHNFQGPNLLFNEAMGTEVYRSFGLPVPEWRPLLVTDSFLDRNPACWFQDLGGPIRPVAGLCFGSRLLAAGKEPVLEILPGHYFDRVANRGAFGQAWLLDICAQHCDNRQAVFVPSPNGALRAVFIDHGHMFGGPRASNEPHPVAPLYLDPRIYPENMVADFRRVSDMLDSSSLWTLLTALPTEWHTTSGLAQFSDFVARITDPSFIRETKLSIADISRRTKYREPPDRRLDNPTATVLCTGLRGPRRRGAIA